MIKRTSDGTVTNEIISDKELSEELHKLSIRKFNKRNVHSFFIENIECADLVDMQLINKFNKGLSYYVLLIFIANMHGLFI